MMQGRLHIEQKEKRIQEQNLLTSITLRALLPALGKMGFSTQEKRGE